MKYALILLIPLYLVACSPDKSESAKVASTNVLVDESFAPIIEDQFLVFENTYPEAKINLIYKPEVQLLNLFLNDSIDVAIMSRNLLPHEVRLFESRDITIRTNRIAVDGIALITHQSSNDSTLTVDEIKAIMQGKSAGRNLVFDNANSSTVRYMKELAKIEHLPKRGVYALQSNDDVIKYVHNNPGTIGVIGINWMKQPSKELEPFTAKLKVMALKNSQGLPGSDKFYKPTQNNLALGLYPLSRELYIINSEGGWGFGTSFAAFIAGERGQRIILKSGLLPDSIPTREILFKKK